MITEKKLDKDEAIVSKPRHAEKDFRRTAIDAFNKEMGSDVADKYAVRELSPRKGAVVFEFTPIGENRIPGDQIFISVDINANSATVLDSM